MYTRRTKKTVNVYYNYNAYGGRGAVVPLFPFDVLGYQIAVVVLEGDFRLGRLVQSMSAQPDTTFGRSAHLHYPCCEQTTEPYYIERPAVLTRPQAT